MGRSPDFSVQLPLRNRLHNGEECGHWATTWIRILVPLLISFVIFGHLLNISVPQFPHLQNGGKILDRMMEKIK